MIRPYLDALMQMPWWAWVQMGLCFAIGIGIICLFIHDRAEYIKRLGDYDMNGRLKK